MVLGKMWFGTEKRMQWIDAPLAGTEMSPQAWNSNGTLLNGGGYSYNSWGSHQQYSFSWGSGSAASMAQVMQAYADGTYGRGLLHFTPPNAYLRNILPKHWADPSMALDYEAPSLRRGVIPTSVDTASPDTNNLPILTTVYDLADTDSGYPGDADSLLIPIPPGATLLLGGIYSTTDSGGVFYSINGGTATAVPNFGATDTALLDVVTSDQGFARIWVGKTAAGAGAVSLTALIGRLVSTLSISTSTEGDPFGEGGFGESAFGGPGTLIIGDPVNGPWVPGMGNTGCRPVGKPTFVPYSPHLGGQASYAITLKEVGGWLL